MKQTLVRPGFVIGLHALKPLAGIAENGGLRIGALATLQSIEASLAVRRTAPLLAAACRHVATVRVRSMATLGGAVAHADLTSIRRPLSSPSMLGSSRAPRATGAKPAGWPGSGLQETWATLDHLVANGVKYVSDWVNDDQPYVMTLEGGRSMVAMPYSHDVNGKPAFERMNLIAPEFQDMICRQFDTLWREGAQSGRVMAIALHPYLTGMPHRIGVLDPALDYICRRDGVWRATGAEIARYYRAAVAAR
ncbi:MAG TPA: FAD binding domain-containing protein [Stellaceae bacterium]|nr:FAD binding domain-containing protein [Stellaceae bacterium]